MRQQPQCCGNSKCQTTQTPLWRKGWFSHEGKTVMLCNACGLHYKKGHYCMYCHQIYRESDADDYANPWIGCDRCSRWVHQKCEEANGHEWKQHKSYLCPDCRCFHPTNTTTTSDTTTTTANSTVIVNTSGTSDATLTTTNPGSQMGKKKTPSSLVIKKRRRTPCGSRSNETPDSPSVVLPHHRALQLNSYSPATPISPGSNFILFSQQQKGAETPTTPNGSSIFDPNNNVMPCWNQLHATIQNLPATPNGENVLSTISPASPTVKKRKLDATFTSQKKSRTTTTITTTTTHRVNSAGIDALMGAVEKSKEELVPHLDLHITVRKGKQTSRKMNADARSAAIASSTDTPTTPTFFSPPLFATMTTTTTTVVPSSDLNNNAKTRSEEQFYQYQQLIMQQQNGVQQSSSNTPSEDGDLSNDSIASVSSSTSTKAPVTILQNTFGSVDKLGNFYGSFNDQVQPETSPYGLLVDDDYEEITTGTRRPQKRTRRTSPPKKVTTTMTTLTMTVSSSSTSPGVKSKRVRDRIAKTGGNRVQYHGTSSDTEESEYEPDEISSWTKGNDLNICLDAAHSVLASRFPKAPVLKKMGSLWAICEVLRQEIQM